MYCNFRANVIIFVGDIEKKVLFDWNTLYIIMKIQIIA